MDSNADNDFINTEGEVILPANATDREIHAYGQTCKLYNTLNT